MSPAHAVLAAVMLIAAAMPAPAAEQGAAAYVKSLYDEPEYPGNDARFTARMEALRAECEKKADVEDDICIDYDMFVQGQDFELSELKVEEVSSGADRTSVKASFRNFGEAKQVDFNLVRGDKGWMIDEMTSGCQSLSALYRHEYCEQP